MKKYAPVILRIGIAFVFIWFGANELLNSPMWVGFIPAWAVSMSGLTALTVVKLNGLLELLLALFLAFGIWIRPVALILSIHLLMIIGDVGLSAVGIRDVGLLFATISIFSQGADMYSYDDTKIKIPQPVKISDI